MKPSLSLKLAPKQTRFISQLLLCSSLLLGMAPLSLTANATDASQDTAATDSLRIPVGQQASDKQSIARPTIGMSKTQVRNQFGEPNTEQPARGNPPISRWDYGTFVVYFEYNTVIHSVLNQ